MSELHSGFGSHCRCAEGEVERLRSAILTLHSRSNEEGEWCEHDGFGWPCATVRALTERQEGTDGE